MQHAPYSHEEPWSAAVSMSSLTEAMSYSSCSADETDRRRLMDRNLDLISQDPMTSLIPACRIGGHIPDMLRLHPGMDRAGARTRAWELLDDVHTRAPDRLLACPFHYSTR